MGAPYRSRACSTVSTARSTPAQYPRGAASSNPFAGISHVPMVGPGPAPRFRAQPVGPDGYPAAMTGSGQSSGDPMPVRVASRHVSRWISQLGQIWVEGGPQVRERRSMVYLTLPRSGRRPVDPRRDDGHDRAGRQSWPTASASSPG